MLNKELKLVLAGVIPLSYFALLWGIPWGEFSLFEGKLSLSYFFDLFFALTVLYLYDKKNILGQLKFPGTLVRVIIVLLLAYLCNLAMTKMSAIESPFAFLDNPALKLLILAPLLEELIFRAALFECFAHFGLKPKIQILINAVLFSLSHGFALLILSEMFHGFIYFQVFYTFLLGWICSKSRISSGGILEPILLHFCFNGVFYYYITQ
ncbi:MAG: hypothetical protein CME62_10815 [Halobacteriovoraceae bacterium]|nr:hypothetical protein [Halobacteriovoraceae bacterium]|tara:strand:- start:6045 stop:6671 length:627 start_codon:yes stop_codon:yes gene_type:complete